MSKLIASAFAGALLVGIGTFGAHAMPMAPLAPGAAEFDATPVAEGCGRGFYRGPGGRCRPMRGGGPAIVVAPRHPIVVAPRACPRGMHWERGRCRPNRF
jgi:hypothetical protein